MGPGARRLRGVAFGVATGVGLLSAGPAHASPDYFASTGGVLSGTTLSIKEGTSPEILDRIVLRGRIPIPGPNQLVTVTVSREGREVVRRQVPTDPVDGRYKTRLKLTGCCEYVAEAIHGTDLSDPVAFEARGPETLEPGPQALLFNRLLEKNGFHMGSVTDQVDESTRLGIVALRKTTGLPISDSYAPKLFTALLEGARFQPVHDEEGRHVEVDISRQVMALVEDGKATDVFGVSTGAGGTPRGEFSFYSKGPGYNAKGMYYSIYYSGNYATHGYSSVPYYPASHGCVRNPLPYAVFIYNWIDLGDRMYIYD